MSKKFRSLVLKSTFKEIERLEPYLRDLQQWADFSDEQFFDIRLATNEAVSNAIVHGNNNDASNKVRIDASLKGNILEISVQDEGPGINLDNIPDPRDEENLLKQSGRGIFLIKQRADDVSSQKKESKLTMRFEIDGE